MKAAAELQICHDQIREGAFRRGLVAVVRANASQWRVAEPAHRLQGAVVASEIYDYYGMYTDAQKALHDYNQAELVAYLKQSAKRPAPTFKRELWVVLAHAQTLYRAERYPEARALLAQCAEILSLVDHNQEAFFGTRARLAYLTGQVLRQLSAYEEGLRQFGESIEFASRRLRQKTPFAEFVAPEVYAASELSEKEKAQRFSHAQKLAHWSIARSLALGIGWIYYVTGRLSDASRCLAVGSALFRSTHDSVHRAYCDLLAGAVTRARSAHQPERIAGSLKGMVEAAKGLRDHPLFRVRAEYEIALAYLHADDLDSAGRTIRSLEEKVTRSPAAPWFTRSHRWNCQLLVLKSRLQRKSRDYVDAAQSANEAATLANRSQQVSLVAEALIAWAEAESEMATSDSLEQAAARLSEARRLAGHNPKTGAVCSLHLARVQLKRGRIDTARDEFKRWDDVYKPLVEHGFVRQLADDVAAKLWSSDGEMKLEGTNFEVNARRLKEVLLRKVLDIPGLSRRDQARRLGLKNERDVVRWIREFRLEPALRGKRRPLAGGTDNSVRP